jgi:hypothetical protein
MFFINKVPESQLRPPKYNPKPKPPKVDPSFLFDPIPVKRKDIMNRKKTKEEEKELKRAKGLMIKLGKEF